MRSFLFLIVAVALLAPTAATAGVVTYGDVSSFNAQGTIAYDSNFSDFPFQTFSFPGDNFYRGGVTYTNEQNLIVGPGYSIGAVQNVITNNYWTPVTGTIEHSPAEYNLFGFDLAVASGPVTITMYTNLNSYVFPGLSIPNGNPTFAFEGFRATDGEYFTGFRLDSVGSGYLPGMTNVEVGIAGAVPEPSVFSAMLLGLGGLIAYARRRKSN